MRGCVAGRIPSLPLLMLLILVLGFLTPTKAADEDPFLTNLALLDDLATKAVDQILDSLGVAAGDSISVLADGYNEGNGFVADAFARSLARRGCSVRMLAGVVTTPEEAAAAPGDEEPAEPDSLSPGGDDGEEEGPEDGDDGQQDDQDQGQDDQGGDSDPGFPDQDPFPDDSTAVSDSIAGGVDQETSGADGTESNEILEEDEDDAVADDQETPPAPQPVPTGRPYPPGVILEFQVLEFGVTYPEIKRRFLLFGATSIQRLGGVYVQAKQIEGPDGEILLVTSGRSHQLDRISGRSRFLAEGAGYPFAQPEVPPGRIGKLAEPMVVLGIISSLVYLFYQNQN